MCVRDLIEPGRLGRKLRLGGRQSKRVNITVVRRVAGLPPRFAFWEKSGVSQGL